MVQQNKINISNNQIVALLLLARSLVLSGARVSLILGIRFLASHQWGRAQFVGFITRARLRQRNHHHHHCRIINIIKGITSY